MDELTIIREEEDRRRHDDATVLTPKLSTGIAPKKQPQPYLPPSLQQSANAQAASRPKTQKEAVPSPFLDLLQSSPWVQFNMEVEQVSSVNELYPTTVVYRPPPFGNTYKVPIGSHRSKLFDIISLKGTEVSIMYNY